ERDVSRGEEPDLRTALDHGDRVVHRRADSVVDLAVDDAKPAADRKCRIGRLVDVIPAATRDRERVAAHVDVLVREDALEVEAAAVVDDRGTDGTRDRSAAAAAGGDAA